VYALGLVPGVTVDRLSPVYETAPWGYEAQHNFTNACVRLSVDISPEALLGVCLGIEAGMGRIREFRNGPRIIDLDLIIYEGEARNTQELKLPHPGMKDRDFVLVPLADIADEPLKAELSGYIAKLMEHYILK
jgi:2-amino-4-hydroxy-6-hydroxymethyldihydropteridine diphosphokinase